jgi:hypothetical protein
MKLKSITAGYNNYHKVCLELSRMLSFYVSVVYLSGPIDCLVKILLMRMELIRLAEIEFIVRHFLLHNDTWLGIFLKN